MGWIGPQSRNLACPDDSSVFAVLRAGIAEPGIQGPSEPSRALRTASRAVLDLSCDAVEGLDSDALPAEVTREGPPL